MGKVRGHWCTVQPVSPRSCLGIAFLGVIPTHTKPTIGDQNITKKSGVITTNANGTIGDLGFRVGVAGRADPRSLSNPPRSYGRCAPEPRAASE